MGRARQGVAERTGERRQARLSAWKRRVLLETAKSAISPGRESAVVSALREPSNLQQTFSNVHSPTVWRIVSSFEFLIKCWELMATKPQHEELKDALDSGVKSLKKWYGRVNSTSSAYFICLVLNPGVTNL
ncbi:hypothetical protein EDB85DRAFT_2145758 [Lactarius pseudohatsudake]|nr:hypothetical protein EDB85DRAFT_2145758 [Lactarius pseudohatsudake]